MQTSLVDVKSASEIFTMKIESHEKRHLYKECVALIESGNLIGASELIIKQDFKKDSTLCLLLSKCFHPTFPYTVENSETEDDSDEIEDSEEDGEDDDIDHAIPSNLLKLLDEAEDQSDKNLDKICNDYYESQTEEIPIDRESYAINLVEMAACMGDEIARRDLLIYCKRNAEYIEGNLLIFMLVDMLEKEEVEAMEHIGYAISAFKDSSMYESAYFYHLIVKDKLYSYFDQVPYQSLTQLLNAKQRIEVENDVQYFLKNRLIPSKYTVLKEDYLASV
jgi:hypothetical protein